MRDGKSRPGLRTGLRDYGFVIILIAVMAVFSLTTTTFLTLENILSLLHESVPLAIMDLGLALVVMTGKLDISIGSIAFLSSAVGMLLMAHNGLPAEIGLPLIVLVGTACGLVNGLACVYLRVNPLITTMGAMFVYRGLALQLTSSRAISVSRALRDLGNARLGPFFFDIAVAAALAIGSNADAAAKLGVRVSRTSLATFVLSGFFAGLVGVSPYLYPFVRGGIILVAMWADARIIDSAK